MPNLNNQVSSSAIAFIDTQVQNYQSLVAGVTPGTEVVVLDGNRDAIDQITQILALRTNIDSIHIVSHGSPGSLQLGNGCLSADNVEAYSEKLQQWRSSLTVDADILIYGCNVASAPRACPKVRQGMNSLSQSSSRLKPTENNLNKQFFSEDFRYETGNSFPGGIGEQARDLDVDLDIDGVAFIQRIAQLTNTNVAASQNLTGSVAKGGDWELEVRTGKIETPLVFEPEVLAGYEYVFANFSKATTFSAGGTGAYSLAVGKLNSDNFPDLVVGNLGSTKNATALLGTGTGSFGTATPLPNSSSEFPVSIAVGDFFNPDGFSDIAIASPGGGPPGSSNIVIWPGTSTGSFGTPTNISGVNPSFVAAGDFNKDGRTDLATGNNQISILLATPTGSFGTPTNISLGPGGSDTFIAVADFDGDGNLDLVATKRVLNRVYFLKGDGTGNFGPTTNFTGVGGDPRSLAVGDFNKDGKPDLVTANYSSNNVSVLLWNSTTNSFNPAVAFGVGTNPESVAVGDFNTDGNLDIVTANYGSNNVSILSGDGGGNFGSATNFNVGTGPRAVAVADLNSDGFSDLATANSGSNDVSILLNVVANFGAATYSGTEGTADTTVNIPVTISGTPFADVTVPIAIDPSSSATQNSDYTISPTTVIFPAGTTTLTQNVAVTIKPDNLPENAETAILNLGTITGGIAGTTKQTTLTIAANGTVSYAIAAGTASIPEGNSGTKPLTFTATRSGNTGGASSINYAITGTATNLSDYNNIGGTSGATTATGTINFAADETSKTITLDVLGDTLVEPDETIAVTLSNPTSPGVTPTITTATATTTITNDDKAGFTINPTALTTSEVGGTATFTVKLNSKPTANVTIGLSSSNLGEGTVSTNSLTFTPANYDRPQPITVSGVDDLVADGPLPYKIVTAAAVSTDPNYNNLDPDDVTVTNSDNETPGITVNPTAGLTTGESGTEANFTVVLNTQPTADVTIGLNSDNAAEGTVSPASITFTPANWNTARPVTVTGVNDSIVDGDIYYKIITAATVSTDANYSNKDVADVSITNKDNDTAGVSITPTATTATEGGANGSYGIELTSQPIAPVTINFNTGSQINAIAPVIFDSTNWNIAKTVTVTATDDSKAEGTHSGTIAHTVTSTDTKYSGQTVQDVNVAITDNDTAGVSISPASTSAAEGGANGSYEIKLTSQPIAPVTITLTTGNQIQAIAPVNFTADNWNVAQPVTVKAVDDTVVEGAHSGTITHSVSGGDAKYNVVVVPGVTVAIADNDVAPPPPPPTPPTPPTPQPEIQILPLTPTPTPTPTTGTPTPTPTPTTGTPTPTPTTGTPTPTPTPTTGTPTPTPTPTTGTPTPTPTTGTPTPTPTPTTGTPTPTPTTGTPTPTPTPTTGTPTPTPTTGTPTPTPTPTTGTPTPTP
ncbi:DUF4347 domain-containing protein, partial [Microcoleus sp. F10B5]|uniref:DUF4347 domain-containing protein n=1 Tax=Microcoleus sp. F10B5 TaxID=3055341 RepID=UPI002FCFB153